MGCLDFKRSYQNVMILKINDSMYRLPILIPTDHWLCIFLQKHCCLPCYHNFNTFEIVERLSLVSEERQKSATT